MLIKMEFTVSSECSSSADDLVEVMKNALVLPKYWHGMREISEIEKGKYSVRFQFPGTGIMEYSCDEKKKICTESYTRGPFTGTKTTSVIAEDGLTQIRTVWNIRLSLILRPMRKRIEKHFTEGTENALRRLCEAAASESERKE